MANVSLEAIHQLRMGYTFLLGLKGFFSNWGYHIPTAVLEFCLAAICFVDYPSLSEYDIGLGP
jgi:hypothetical protein